MSNKPYKIRSQKIEVHKILISIKSRLTADVSPYIELVRSNYDENKVVIGNFALIRMMAPVIESLAKTVDKSPQYLLGEIGVKFPYLYWSLFRDVFMHNDEFLYAILNDKNAGEITVRPGLSLSLKNTPGLHTVGGPFVTLSLTGLYDDLVIFIDRQLKEPNKMAKMPYAIEYMPDYEGPHKEELDNIIKEIRQFNKEQNKG